MEITGRIGEIAWYRQGTGPPRVLFLHGFSDSAACWDPIIAQLRGRWPSLALDARGHGQSGLPDESATPAAHAEDAARVLDEVAAAPVVVVGHSMGAGTAAELARRRPELVRALVLEDPMLPRSDRWVPRTPGPMSDSLRQLRAVSLADRIARARMENPNWPDDELAPWAVSKAQLDERFTKLRAAGDDPLTVLSALRCPVLLIHGDADKGSIVDPDAATALLERATTPVRVVHIDGVGHSVRREARARFLAELTEFLERFG